MAGPAAEAELPDNPICALVLADVKLDPSPIVTLTGNASAPGGMERDDPEMMPDVALTVCVTLDDESN